MFFLPFLNGIVDKTSLLNVCFGGLPLAEAGKAGFLGILSLSFSCISILGPLVFSSAVFSRQNRTLVVFGLSLFVVVFGR